MSKNHWSRMARHWHLVGSPLRPAVEDIQIFQDAVAVWKTTHARAPRVLILGVTPELYGLEWPTGTQLLAMDRALEMIREIWPDPSGMSLQCLWTSMALADSSCDIVLCDGGFGLLAYQEGQRGLLRELQRIMAPRGIFAVRLFSPCARTGTVNEIFSDLATHRIASLDALKLRLWGALHGRRDEGVRPSDVVSCILERVGSFDRLAVEQGWSLEYCHSLELHLNSKAVYYLTEVSDIIYMATEHRGGFEYLTIVEPAYPLGNCCPILTLRRV